MNEHAQIINMLAATFDRFGWDDAALAGYLLALSDIDVDRLRRAASEVLRTHTGKMPTPAEIRRIALALMTPQLPGPDEAWAEVLAAIAHNGRDAGMYCPHSVSSEWVCDKCEGSIQWTHPLIGTAVEYLGWRRLCDSTDPTGDRIAFTRTYRSLTERAEREALTAPGLVAGALDAAAPVELPAFRLRHIQEAGRRRPLALAEGTDSERDAARRRTATTRFELGQREAT